MRDCDRCVFVGYRYENEINTSENSDTSNETSGGTLESNTHTPDTKISEIEKREMKNKVTGGNYEVIFRFNDGTVVKSLYEQLKPTIEAENLRLQRKDFLFTGKT